MSMRRYSGAVLGLLGFFALGITSCGESTIDNASVDAAEEIPIGVILPLTGSGAVWGENARKGIDLALNEINGQGGVSGQNVKLFYEDSQTLPRFAVAALNKLIAVGDVQACIVDMVSSNVLAMAPIANREQVVILSPGASSPKITTAGEYVFRNWPSDAIQGELNARYAFDVMHARTSSVLYINNEYGKGLQATFDRRFTQLGGTIAATESFEQGASDFRSLLTKLNTASIDLLYVLAYPKEWPPILIQAKELRLSCPILGTETAEDPAILEQAKDAAEGLVYSLPKAPDDTDARVSHFRRAFIARYGEDPGICADAGYDALYLLTDAIRTKGYSGPAIRDHLFTVQDYHGAAGITTFDVNGDCIKPFMFKKIENGEAIVVE